MQDVVVGVRIDSLTGDPVWGTNTRRSGTHDRAARRPGDASTSRSPSLPLLEGVYDLTVALTDHTEIHPYDHWERRIRFEVRQYRSYDTGLVHIPAEWTITGDEGRAAGGLMTSLAERRRHSHVANWYGGNEASRGATGVVVGDRPSGRQAERRRRATRRRTRRRCSPAPASAPTSHASVPLGHEHVDLEPGVAQTDR